MTGLIMIISVLLLVLGWLLVWFFMAFFAYACYTLIYILFYILFYILSGPVFFGRSQAPWSSLAADHRPSPWSATGSTRSMPITPELHVHGSPPRRFCWPWLRGAGGKRRVKLSG